MSLIIILEDSLSLNLFFFSPPGHLFFIFPFPFLLQTPTRNFNFTLLNHPCGSYAEWVSLLLCFQDEKLETVFSTLRWPWTVHKSSQYFYASKCLFCFWFICLSLLQKPKLTIVYLSLFVSLFFYLDIKRKRLLDIYF